MYAVHISNLSIRHRSAAVITIIVRLIIKFKYYCAAEKKFLFFSFLNPTIPFFQDIFYNIFFFVQFGCQPAQMKHLRIIRQQPQTDPIRLFGFCRILQLQQNLVSLHFHDFFRTFFSESIMICNIRGKKQKQI